MDADTRHHLKQNELAEALAKLREFNDPRFRQAMIALGVIVVVVLGIYAWRYNRTRTLESRWRTLSDLKTSLDANDPAGLERAQGDLRNFINDASDAGLAGYARLQLAASYNRAALLTPDQRPAGFQKAKEELAKVTSSPETPPLLAAAASFALATTCESLTQFDEARTLYATLSEEARFEGTPFRGLATGRLASLEKLSKLAPLTPGGPPMVATQEELVLPSTPPNLSPTPPPTMTPMAAPPPVPVAPVPAPVPTTQPAAAAPPATPTEGAPASPPAP